MTTVLGYMARLHPGKLEIEELGWLEKCREKEGQKRETPASGSVSVWVAV
jgi:hypothetical protein